MAQNTSENLSLVDSLVQLSFLIQAVFDGLRSFFGRGTHAELPGDNQDRLRFEEQARDIGLGGLRRFGASG